MNWVTYLLLDLNNRIGARKSGTVSRCRLVPICDVRSQDAGEVLLKPIGISLKSGEGPLDVGDVAVDFLLDVLGLEPSTSHREKEFVRENVCSWEGAIPSRRLVVEEVAVTRKWQVKTIDETLDFRNIGRVGWIWDGERRHFARLSRMSQLVSINLWNFGIAISRSECGDPFLDRLRQDACIRHSPNLVECVTALGVEIVSH